MTNKNIINSIKPSNPSFSHSSSKQLGIIFVLLKQMHFIKIKTKNKIIPPRQT